MPPIKVLWTVKQLDRGGTETLLLNTARCLDPAEVEVSVVYLTEGRNALEVALARHVNVTCLATRYVLDPTWALRLRNLIKAERVEIVHSHSPVMAVASRLVCQTVRPRPALVSTYHGAWRSYRRPTRAAELVTAGLDDAQLVVSEAARRSLPSSIAKRARVLTHGVDLQSLEALTRRRRELRQNLGVEDTARLVVSVANLHALKDHETLLRAARTVITQLPDVIFWLVGDGPRKPRLELLSAELDLGERVRFLGMREDALSLVAAADLFVLSSFSEGLPISVVESIALGVPVVATDVGGVRETFTHGIEGLLVPVRSPDRLAQALITVLNDTSLRTKLGAAALRRRANFDANTTAQRLTDLYKGLARRAS
jgi:glycosyltransferase involved in cell wall biosynthesis